MNFPGIKQIELVYFDICARGELSRLCFAAAGMLDKFKDTRLPLFMESEAAAQEWSEVHQPKTPFGFVPYLNVTCCVTKKSNPNAEEGSEEAEQAKEEQVTRQISGDGVVEAFVARYTGLLGDNEVDASTITTISNEAVGLQGPQLTRAGLNKRDDLVMQLCNPNGPYGHHLVNLETFVNKLVNQKPDGSSYHAVGDKMTLADLAIYNCLDECIRGPRSDFELPGLAEMCMKEYPTLMKIYSGVAVELKAYISSRTRKFTERKEL